MPIIAGIIGGEEGSRGKMIKLKMARRKLYLRPFWTRVYKNCLLLYAGPVFVGVYW